MTQVAIIVIEWNREMTNVNPIFFMPYLDEKQKCQNLINQSPPIFDSGKTVHHT